MPLQAVPQGWLRKSTWREGAATARMLGATSPPRAARLARLPWHLSPAAAALCCLLLPLATALHAPASPSARLRGERAGGPCMAAPTSSGEESGTPPDPAKELGRRIFCNRALNMRQIKAVGFDLDYTLAEYIPETFDVLAYEGRKRRFASVDACTFC